MNRTPAIESCPNGRGNPQTHRNFIANPALTGYFVCVARGSGVQNIGNCVIAALKRATMVRLLTFIAALVSCAIGLVAASGPAQAERRVALVIGNSNYKQANISLSNPKNDAQDISATLTSLGFEVVTTVDATKREMDLSLQTFARLAINADSALFFYAGHAMQFQGRNYLMPVDAELEDEISVRYQTVAIDEVRAALDRANGVKIMILDACRNNPLADRLQRTLYGSASRAIETTRGLARIDKTQGMVVAYATAADDVAQDGTGRNSPFTTALLRRLQEPGLEIEMMFRRVAFDVNAQTGGRQRPETYISLLSEYYLNQNDRIVWDRIKDQDDVAALRDFINKYPSSPHAVFARNRLDLLERYVSERAESARRAREEEQRKAAEAEAQRIARETLARREEEERQRADQRRFEDDQKRIAAIVAQQLEQRRIEDEQKRLAALAAQQAEQKRAEEERLAALAAQQAEQKRSQDEQKRLAAQQSEQKRIEDEQKRIAALTTQQAEQKRIEDEQKRLAALTAQQAEQRRIEDEQKRLAALTAQQAEQKRIEDEQKRLAALAAQQAEQKRIEDEQKRLAALAAQQAEQKRLAALAAQQAEQKRIEDEQKRLAALAAQQAEQKRIEEEQKRFAVQAQTTPVDPERKRIEDTCRREEAELARIQAAGGPDVRADLTKFGIEVSCKALRPLVTAALDSLPTTPSPVATPPAPVVNVAPPAASANSAEQIRKAQVELRRVGCYPGRPDGKLNEATQNAVRNYWSRTGQAIVEINITDEFISDIEHQDEHICGPNRRPESTPVARPHHEREPREARPAREREAPRQEARPSAPPPPARATASSPSGGSHAIGVGF